MTSTEDIEKLVGKVAPVALAVAKYIERMGRTVTVEDWDAHNAWRGVVLGVDDRYRIRVIHDPIRNWSEEYPYHQVIVDECRALDALPNDKRPGAYYRVNASMSHAIQIKHDTFEWWTRMKINDVDLYGCPRELGTIVDLRTGEECRAAIPEPVHKPEPEPPAQLPLFDNRRSMHG